MSANMGAQTKTTPRDWNAGATATKEFSSLSQSQDIPVGLCQCGCGGKTKLATRNDTADGRVIGQPVRYLKGHNRRKSGVYLEEDRGHETPCWIWQLYVTPNGYGQTWADGRLQQAHRVFYERHIGPIPGGLVIDHLCRTPSCVNPEHLEPVTHTENVWRGAQSKLNLEKAQEIRASSSGAAELALHFGIHRSAISRVRNGRIWKAPA